MPSGETSTRPVTDFMPSGRLYDHEYELQESGRTGRAY
jgi:hypothetical protein